MGTAARSPPVAVSTPPSAASPHAASPLPALRPDFGDDTLFTVYCFIRDFIGSSGTSAVAIDNKIEQAMDLVKSHLMFAVREEVEVLKEKIVELTGRINQLEYENTVLKAHATQETLQQLAVPPQQQQQQQAPQPSAATLQQQVPAPAPQPAATSAAMLGGAGGGGGKPQQAPTSVS